MTNLVMLVGRVELIENNDNEFYLIVNNCDNTTTKILVAHNMSANTKGYIDNGNISGVKGYLINRENSLIVYATKLTFLCSKKEDN